MPEAGGRELAVEHGQVTLAGALWMPIDIEIRAVVLMYPGSGSSDRNNNGYFSAIRDIFLGASCAVASFDKRGVGGSGGDWRRAPIEVQAGDLLACVRAIQAQEEVADTPTGVFGHSQGGWVAVEAASRSNAVDFVIVSSGPGVTPAAQERHAARHRLERPGTSPEEVERGLHAYEEMVRQARSGAPFSEVDQPGVRFLPEDVGSEEWKFWISILDYDPKGPLSRITVPILTLWGGDDRIVPVEESIEVYRATVPSTRLTVEVFAGANHRIEAGDPPRLAPGYAERIQAFLDANV